MLHVLTSLRALTVASSCTCVCMCSRACAQRRVLMYVAIAEHHQQGGDGRRCWRGEDRLDSVSQRPRAADSRGTPVRSIPMQSYRRARTRMHTACGRTRTGTRRLVVRVRRACGNGPQRIEFSGPTSGFALRSAWLRPMPLKPAEQRGWVRAARLSALRSDVHAKVVPVLRKARHLHRKRGSAQRTAAAPHQPCTQQISLQRTRQSTVHLLQRQTRSRTL